MSNGWIKLYRDLMNKPIWQCATPNQRSVMITILLMANHEEKQWQWEGKKYVCEPGEFITSATALAEAAGVGRQVVRSSLERLKFYQFLTYKTTKQSTKLKINNWAHYQDTPTNEVTNPLTNEQPTSNQRVTTNKNKKKNIIINNNIYGHSASDDRFEEFWAEYPKKVSKIACRRHWDRYKLNSLADSILRSVKAYKKSDGWQRGYVHNPLTFLSQQKWNDEVFDSGSKPEISDSSKKYWELLLSANKIKHKFDPLDVRCGLDYQVVGTPKGMDTMLCRKDDPVVIISARDYEPVTEEPA